MTMKNQNRQKGVALLLALILLLVITAIAFGVIVMSNTESAINTNYKSEETEYFAARAGVEEARYRLLGSAVDQNGNSIALTPPAAPGAVLYILGCKVQNPTTGACQTQMSMTDVTTATLSTGGPSPYFDDELCHDIPGSTQLAPNVRCGAIPAVTQLPAATSVSPYPMDYIWVRIMMKENGSVAPYPVVSSGATSATTNTVCFDKTLSPPQEISTSLPTDCSSGGSWPGARPVYMVTALALNSGKNTRRLVQEEVTLGVVYYPTYAIYNTSNACPSMTFTGNAMTGSFASVAGNTSNPPPGASTTTGANVATNGGINMGAGNPTIAGQAYETNGNPPTCFTAGKNQQPPAATYLSPNALPMPTVYPAPNPPPPTTNTNYKNGTLTPGNTYGNVSVSGSGTLTLQVPAGQGTVSNPATFVFNSLTEAGQGTITIAPANSGACNGTTTCYVKIVIAGNGVATPLDLSGGSLVNPSGVPATVVFDVAQPTSCSAAPCGTINMSGGTDTYCIVNAPMDNMNVVGDGAIFGSLTSYTSTMKGNGTIWYDRNLGGQYNPDTYLSVLSFRELSY